MVDPHTERGVMQADRSAHTVENYQHEEAGMFVAKLTRRGALGAFAALGVGLLAACGGDDDSSAGTTSPRASTTPSTPPSTTTTTGGTSPSATASAVTTGASG